MKRERLKKERLAFFQISHYLNSQHGNGVCRPVPGEPHAADDASLMQRDRESVSRRRLAPFLSKTKG